MSITTISSREFNQKTNEAKKAAQNGPVFITDRGQTAHVLLTIGEYQKITSTGKNLLEMLSMPKGADICEDFDSLIPHSRELARGADLK